jgi:hypothetical protein
MTQITHGPNQVDEWAKLTNGKNQNEWLKSLSFSSATPCPMLTAGAHLAALHPLILEASTHARESVPCCRRSTVLSPALKHQILVAGASIRCARPRPAPSTRSAASSTGTRPGAVMH